MARIYRVVSIGSNIYQQLRSKKSSARWKGWQQIPATSLTSAAKIFRCREGIPHIRWETFRYVVVRSNPTGSTMSPVCVLTDTRWRSEVDVVIPRSTSNSASLTLIA